MRLLGQVIILSLIVTFNVQAAVYRWVDDNGVVVYSDKPQKGAEIVDIPVFPVYKSHARKPNHISSTRNGQPAKEFTYTDFKITSPADDTTIRSNPGIVSVSMQVTPRLQSGHKIILALDGKGTRISSPRYTYKGVDRGTHKLSAKIINSDGNIVKSSGTVAFHLFRQSVLQRRFKTQAK